jgi:ketosteroid isomerase-like protein
VSRLTQYCIVVGSVGHAGKTVFSPGTPDRVRSAGLPISHLLYDDGGVTDHAAVHRWIAGYELAWRTPGTDGLAELFTADATYLHSPYEEPVTGLQAIADMWEDDREGPDEFFTLSTEIVAVERDTAVVRAQVQYGEPTRQEYRDLWLIRFHPDERCAHFEEWPYWPGQPYAARDKASPAQRTSETNTDVI